MLIVEDNELNSDMLSRRLARQGFEVIVAVDAELGISMMRSEKPDLVLMDLSLPKMDGWEATRLIKADNDLESTPVIALTAHALATDRQKAFDAGCDDFDTKPVDFNRLLGKIEAVLNHQD